MVFKIIRGTKLLEECRTLGGCETGNAKITKGYDLPCRDVIHTVGPIWQGGDHDEKQKLISCYQKSLELAAEHHCRTVAFPLISAGVYGYPKEAAMHIAAETICNYLRGCDMQVFLVLYDKNLVLPEDLKAFEFVG